VRKAGLEPASLAALVATSLALIVGQSDGQTLIGLPVLTRFSAQSVAGTGAASVRTEIREMGKIIRRAFVLQLMASQILVVCRKGDCTKAGGTNRNE
jgi:hypothetical protein